MRFAEDIDIVVVGIEVADTGVEAAGTAEPEVGAVDTGAEAAGTAVPEARVAGTAVPEARAAGTAVPEARVADIAVPEVRVADIAALGRKVFADAKEEKEVKSKKHSKVVEDAGEEELREWKDDNGGVSIADLINNN